MQLNLTTDYALRCLLVLNGQKNGVSSKDISTNIGIEREFTLKVLRQLREAGFVESIKGKAGGYKLARPLSKIALLDVLNVMEDTMYINRCVEPDHYCSRNGVELNCPAHHFYEAFQAKLEDVLSSITLQDILDDSFKL